MNEWSRLIWHSSTLHMFIYKWEMRPWFDMYNISNRRIKIFYVKIVCIKIDESIYVLITRHHIKITNLKCVAPSVQYNCEIIRKRKRHESFSSSSFSSLANSQIKIWIILLSLSFFLSHLFFLFFYNDYCTTYY